MWPDAPPCAVSPALTSTWSTWHTEAAISPSHMGLPLHVPMVLNVLPHTPVPLLCPSSSPASIPNSYLITICSAPLHSFSQHLYIQPLPYNYPFLILTSLLSLLCEFYVTSVSTHLSPMPGELTLPSQSQPLYNFHYFNPSPLSLITAKRD